jgi:hypothetical protein
MPETDCCRPGHDIRDGGGDIIQQPFTVIVTSPMSRRVGEAYARRRAAMDGPAIISDEGVRGSSRDLPRHERWVFRLPSPPPISARPESHMSLGQASPTRPAHVG